ncbi:MAG: D-alanyl-D-alanine carboxypeptidase/D-alanyl-D-alanine-endopeptidase [Gemmatimonadaceae bacterium]
MTVFLVNSMLTTISLRLSVACLTIGTLCACASSATRPETAPTTTAGVGTVAALRTSIDSMVAEPKFRSMEWGILIVDPERGDTLYAHNAGKLFMPASNQKILTGTTALHLLGGGFRFATTVGSTGAISDGVLGGDLVVTGTGDPSISDNMSIDAMIPLRAIADSLIARGVKTIRGGLTRGGDYFSDGAYGYGWEWDDFDFPYSAGVEELFFNEGFSRIILRGGDSPGAPVAIRTTPARTFPRVTNLAHTVEAGTVTRRTPNAPRVRQDSADISGVIVEGNIAAGDSAVVSISHRDQNAAYLLALREALADRGIMVEGAVSARVPQPATYPLFTIMSPTLRQILPAFEKPSQNQIGEILLKTLGRERTGSGRADSGAVVVRNQLLAWGALPDGFVVRDGSGLSRHDLVSPETLVKTLAAIRSDTAFRAFYDALPIAGVDGTIANRMKQSAAQGNVHAKTGSLDMVRSLSGYVTTADGRMVIFSVLANNWIVPVKEIEAVQDSIGVRLAQLHLKGAR